MDKDFNMCVDDDCPSKDKCYRYTADPIVYGQAFFFDYPRYEDDDKCDYFVVNKGRGKRTSFYRKVRDIK